MYPLTNTVSNVADHWECGNRVDGLPIRIRTVGSNGTVDSTVDDDVPTMLDRLVGGVKVLG